MHTSGGRTGSKGRELLQLLAWLGIHQVLEISLFSLDMCTVILTYPQTCHIAWQSEAENAVSTKTREMLNTVGRA